MGEDTTAPTRDTTPRPSEATAAIEGCLGAFAAAHEEQGLGTYGVHVSLPGAPGLERRFRSDDRVNVYSVAKSVTALAVLLAEHEGRLGLDEPFLAYLPEFAAGATPGLERVTLRQLLTMTSGSSHVWYAHMPLPSGDLLRDVLAAPMAADPGERFRYSGVGPYVAGRVLHRVTGADVRAYLLPRLFTPLGIDNPAWHTCPLGFPFAEGELFLRTEELGRLVRLVADEGEYAGRRVLPVEVVRALSATRVDTSGVTYGDIYNDGYGLGVWHGPAHGEFRMDGRYGQYGIVVPGARLAVAVTAHTENEGPLLRAIRTHIVDPLVAAAPRG